MSVIARAVFTGRKRARVVGDADPYGCPARWMSAWRRGEGTPPYRERHGGPCPLPQSFSITGKDVYP